MSGQSEVALLGHARPGSPGPIRVLIADDHPMVRQGLQVFLGLQGDSATNAQQLAQGQDVVVNTLQQSYNTATGVNMDAQMSNLISLQNAYSANAHVMAVVQSMFTTLLQAM